jgi:selenocysteine lyase/cysteine desulfurase
MKYISKNKTLFTFKQPRGKIRSLFSDIVYLDNNATTPLAPEVTNVMAKCLGENFGNPSSAHLFGRKAGEAVEKARKKVAELIGATSDEITWQYLELLCVLSPGISYHPV